MPDRRLAASSVVTAVAAAVLSGCGGHEASNPVGSGSQPSTPSSHSVASPTTTATTRPHSVELLAERLRRLDRRIDSRRTTPSDLRRAGERQQLLLRTLGLHPGEERRVLARLPPMQRRRTAATLRAGHLLRSMFPVKPGALSRVLPAWRIERPAPAPELWADYHQAQRRYGVGWSYLAAINMVESSFGRVHGLSTAGARGPMQFIPATWRAYGAGGDIQDPHDAVLGAARLLSANGFARTPLAALRHYNDSSAYARAVTLLADVMRRDPRQFFGFYHWRVFYLTARGNVLLPVGYDERRSVPVRSWLARHPDALVLP